MTLVTLMPNGDGDSVGTVWASSDGGTPHYQYIDEISQNGDIDYLSAGFGVQQIEAFTLDDWVAGAKIIVDVSPFVYVRSLTLVPAGDATLTLGLRLGGVTQEDTPFTVNFFSPWTLYSASISKPGGGSWLYSDLTALQATMKSNASASGDQIAVTQLGVEVIYSGNAPLSSTPKRHNYRLRVRR